MKRPTDGLHANQQHSTTKMGIYTYDLGLDKLSNTHKLYHHRGPVEEVGQDAGKSGGGGDGAGEGDSEGGGGDGGAGGGAGAGGMIA